MKTAEEFLEDYLSTNNLPWSPEMEKQIGCVYNAMIEFAKMHVKEALRLASEEAEVEHELSNPYDPNSGYEIVNKDSILNAYPLENIK